jgi:hypothetical protein
VPLRLRGNNRPDPTLRDQREKDHVSDRESEYEDFGEQIKHFFILLELDG